MPCCCTHLSTSGLHCRLLCLCRQPGPLQYLTEISGRPQASGTVGVQLCPITSSLTPLRDMQTRTGG